MRSTKKKKSANYLHHVMCVFKVQHIHLEVSNNMAMLRMRLDHSSPVAHHKVRLCALCSHNVPPSADQRQAL